MNLNTWELPHTLGALRRSQSFERRWAHPPNGRMPTPLVIQHFEVVDNCIFASPFLSNRSPSSLLTVEKNAPSPRRSAVKSIETNCEQWTNAGCSD